MVEVEIVDGVHVVRMTDGENRCNGPFVEALSAAVAAVEDIAAPLVLTGEGKFFSNGLDLEWLGADPDAAEVMFDRLHDVLRRLLVFPAPTVAAVNGHAFGAGAILAAAADHRVMRSDRGYVCFPEVDLGLTMSPGFDAVLRARYPRRLHLDALVTGHRYGGDDALAAGLVDQAVPEPDLLPTAVALAAAGAGKPPAHVRALKEQVHGPELSAFAPPPDA
jgi:enoyl-CoA hydratase/carnithine racemase